MFNSCIHGYLFKCFQTSKRSADHQLLARCSCHLNLTVRQDEHDRLSRMFVFVVFVTCD